MGRRGHAHRAAPGYRSAVHTAVLLLLTIGWGLAIRFAPLGLPHSLVKYGGSALWALAIYWLVSACVARQHLLRAALIAGGLATAVELFKLHHTPGLDAFRRTVAGVLLFGRHFSLQDVLVYWCAVLAGCLLDVKVCRRSGR